jgi:hypothetical protein
MTDGYGYEPVYGPLGEDIPDHITEAQLRRQYRALEFKMRGDILATPASDYQTVLEGWGVFTEQDDFEEHEGLLEEDTAEDDERFQEEDEYEPDLIDVDEPFYELPVVDSPFDTTPLAQQGSGSRSAPAGVRRIHDVVIEESAAGTLDCYTPGDEIIRRFELHSAFHHLPKARWLATIVLRAVEERQRHLQQLGAFLCRRIEAQPAFFAAASPQEAFARLEDFTPEAVSAHLGIHKVTVGRLREGTSILLPHFGEMSLDRIFELTKATRHLEITKAALHNRIMEVLRRETSGVPRKTHEIAREVGLSRERVGQILRELGIPSRFGMRQRAYKEGKAWWL